MHLLKIVSNFSILQIAALVSSEFGVEFRMMGKVDVKGSNVHPVWKYLTGETTCGTGDLSVELGLQ